VQVSARHLKVAAAAAAATAAAAADVFQ